MHNTPPDLVQNLPDQWRHQLAAAKHPAPNLQTWWTIFQAPDLNLLINQTLKQNLTLAAAREHIQAARDLAQNSHREFLPDLHLRTDDLPAPSAANSYFRMGIDSSWELGLFGKQQATEQIAQGDVANVEAQAQLAQVSVIAEVVKNWISLRSGQQQTMLLDQSIEKNTRQLVLTEHRVEIGLSAPSALGALTSALARTKTLRLEKQLEVDQSLEQLALLQGRNTPDPAWSVPTQQPVIGDFATPGIPVDLIRTRPDIREAEAVVLQAVGQLGVAKAERYPSVTLAASYMYSVQLLGKFNFHNSNVHGVSAFGPEIDIPLFDWGIRKAKADAQGAELNAAVLSYRQVVLGAIHEVESSIRAVEIQQQRIQEQLKIVDAAQQGVRAHESLLQLGLASPLELLEDQLILVQAQLELADLQTAHDLACVALYKALAGAPLDFFTPMTRDVSGAKQSNPYATPEMKD